MGKQSGFESVPCVFEEIRDFFFGDWVQEVQHVGLSGDLHGVVALDQNATLLELELSAWRQGNQSEWKCEPFLCHLPKLSSIGRDQLSCLKVHLRNLLQLLFLPRQRPILLVDLLLQLFPDCFAIILATEYTVHVCVQDRLGESHILLVLLQDICRNEHVEDIIQPPPQVLYCLDGQQLFRTIFPVLVEQVLQGLSIDIEHFQVKAILLMVHILAQNRKEDVIEILDGYLLATIQQPLDIPSHGLQASLIHSSSPVLLKG